MKLKKLFVFLFCFLTILSCNREDKKRQPPPAPVSVVEVALKDMPIQVSAIGNVEAYSSVTIKSRVEGQLLKALCKEGDEVKRGQLLFVIDPRPFEEALRQAEANLLRDKAQLEFARADLERYEELFREGLVSRQQFDKIRTNYETLRSVVKSGEASVNNARLLLSYCYIHSPIDGKVGTFSVQPGNMVKANETAITTVNQIVPVYVRFSVPEREILRIRQAMSAGTLIAEAVLKGVDSETIREGRVVFIDNAVDPQTGTVRLKALFENRDRVLWPGQFVNVVLKLGVKKNALVIPARAVQTGQKGNYVFVVKNDKTAEIREIQLGVRVGDEVSIETGLNPKELVVVDGQLRLTQGARVEIRK